MAQSDKKPPPWAIPIKLHEPHPLGVIDPTHTQLEKPIVQGGKTYTSWSYITEASDAPISAAGPSMAVELTAPPPPIVEPPKKKHKRKFEAFNVNEMPDSMFGGTLRPNKPHACLSHSAEAIASNQPVYGSSWPKGITDNDRSDNPSDHEVALEKKKEAERARVRAEAAAARKYKKPGPKRKGSNNVTASGSRNASPAPEVDSSPLGALGTIAASTAPSGMKRTRSNGGGVGPISNVLANALGTGSVNVSSPLKAVTGPNNTPEEIVATNVQEPAPSESRRGRSRLSGDSNSPPNQNGNKQKANSHSPTTNTVPLVRDTASHTLPPVNNNPLSRNASIGGNDMRRVVSASNIGRRGAPGSPLAPEGSRERSRREVILPGRLRDYDVKAGTST